ncbi:MAG: ester cyclase [Proteobacteria bacterium]|nr:ester cyclase [Pseudomonadota bacterium]
MTTNSLVQIKRSLFERLRAFTAAGADAAAAGVRALYSAGATCSVAHPVNDLAGPVEILAGWWLPLFRSFPDVERRDVIAVSGEFEGKAMVAMVGHYQGTFSAPFFDIPPTNQVATLRYGEVHEVVGGRICRSWILIDFVDLMLQARCWPLAPSLGVEAMWPGPVGNGGLLLDVVDSIRGAASLQIVTAMHVALRSFDGRTLESMDHAKYWTRDFMWYGPSGIGTTRGLAGFRAHHQIPFLRTVPDRGGGSRITGFGDGDFVVTGGWPGMSATHTGGDWLGLAPTGRRFTIRVMDFYRLENGLIAENWVPIDILDILNQIGLDVFARMRHISGRPRVAL